MDVLKIAKKNKKELIQEIIKLVFEKAKKDSNETKAYGLSNYLYNELKEKINERTLTRYYDGYVLMKENERRTPSNYTLDVFCLYLGFQNFDDFVLKSVCEIENKKLREEKLEVEKKLYHIKLIGAFSGMILLVLSILFISKYYKKNCMIWVEDHYEKIRCSGLETEKPLDEAVLENLRKVAVCEDTVFFEFGKPRIHYLKFNKKVEFFTHTGEHPIYDGKYLNEITRDIINAHVKPCDSIIE